MSNQHTPEPWNYTQEGKDAFGIIEPDGTSILHMQALKNSTAASRIEANARRICACVNACAGLPDDALTGKGHEMLHNYFAFKAITQQRDELLDALHRISLGSQNSMTSFASLGAEARAAITKVKP